MDTSIEAIMKRMESMADPKASEHLARYGIITGKAYGISSGVIRALSREIGTNHALAAKLWRTGILDARGLATLIDDPAKVTEAQMERWVLDFDNWATCDACCMNLFDATPYAWTKAAAWCGRKEEFVRRAGFALIAVLAVHDKSAADKQFEKFLPLIKRYATDERNFVKKAVNWALRQIGKRNLSLNATAISAATEIRKLDSSSARWIAADALRELRSYAVQQRLNRKR
jgi:3-methyladenine DNA glycosylase AlkD